ncbi:MAG: hypothetical protein LUD76_10140 [Alistipes sp.]|nr:hypothetical protein [Alistipes sp.]
MSYKPPYTLENYNALRTATMTGVKSVSYSDKKMEYRSLDEMLRLLREMEADLFGRSRRRRYLTFDRGYNPE